MTYFLGITGGIGSGKSTVAKNLKLIAEDFKISTEIIDADFLAKNIVENNFLVISKIKKKFGSQSFNSDNILNREFMRNLIFQNSQAKKDLEEITIPEIRKKIWQQAKELQQSKTQLIIFEIPLISQYWKENLDSILVIICQEKTQIARVQKRNNLNIDQIKNIINSQISIEERLKFSDFVFENDNLSLSTLRLRLEDFFMTLKLNF